MKNAAENDSKKRKHGPIEYEGLFFQLESEAALLFFKTMLLMNSGALISLLISITRTEDSAISAVLIETSTWFGYGLTFALLGLLFYTPYAEYINELEPHFKRRKFQLSIAVLSILASAFAFLFGIWETISSLKETLVSS